MRPLILGLTIISLISSCQANKERIVEGDLYFKSFDFERYFDASDSMLTNIENSVRKVNIDSLDKKGREKYKAFKYMVDNDLLRRPFIRLRLDNGDIKILLLSTGDYGQLAEYKFSDLSRKKEKIRIKVIITDFDYPHFLEDEVETAYNGLKVLSINKIKGETYWTK